MRWSQKILLGLVGFCWLPFNHAVEVQQNQLYPGGTLIESSELGLSFSIPEGWQGAWPAGSELFVMESQALKANIFVYIAEANEQGLQQQMAQPIPLDEETLLHPKQLPQKDKGWITADYSVSNRPQLEARIRGKVGRGNTAVAFIAISDTSTAKQTYPVAASLAQSLTFFEPKGVPQSDPRAANSWQNYMQGRHIVRFYSGSNYHEKEEIWLCSNGVFYRSGNFGGFSGGASGASANQGTGQWKAQGNLQRQGQLILQYSKGYQFEGSTPGFDWSKSGPGGERVTFTLTLANDKLYLNDTQWLRDQNHRCQ